MSPPAPTLAAVYLSGLGRVTRAQQALEGLFDGAVRLEPPPGVGSPVAGTELGEHAIRFRDGSVAVYDALAFTWSVGKHEDVADWIDNASMERRRPAPVFA